MKRVSVVLTAAALAAGSGYAYLGQVIASFPTPWTYPIALACGNDASQMWVFCNWNPFQIWRINAETGSVYGSFTKSSTRGLAYSSGGAPGGNYLWIGNVVTDKLYMCNPTTGSHYRTWALVDDAVRGLAPQATGDGGYNPQAIIVTDGDPPYTYYYDPTTGSVIRSHANPHAALDVAWDWRNRLIWGGYGPPHIVYGWNTSGSLVATFAAPSAYPFAMTYRGQYLWVGCTIPVHHIYKVHCPVFVGVSPASLGRVKALFK